MALTGAIGARFGPVRLFVWQPSGRFDLNSECLASFRAASSGPIGGIRCACPIPLLTPWPLLIFRSGPFGAYRDFQFWNYPLQGLLFHEDGITS